MIHFFGITTSLDAGCSPAHNCEVIKSPAHLVFSDFRNEKYLYIQILIYKEGEEINLQRLNHILFLCVWENQEIYFSQSRVYLLCLKNQWRGSLTSFFRNTSNLSTRQCIQRGRQPCTHSLRAAAESKGTSVLISTNVFYLNDVEMCRQQTSVFFSS